MNKIIPEIINFDQSTSELHVHKEAHTKDGKYKHHKKEQQTNVEQGWHGHGQCEQQCTNAACAFDKPQDAAYLGDTNNTEQGGRNKVFLDQVT